MKIGIDASRAFVKNRTGTENYSYQLIKALAQIDHKNQYILYTRNSDCSDPGSEWPQNCKIVNIRRNKLWTQIGLAREVLFHPPDVLFVPAHTLPVIRRPGLKTVVTIHDLGYEYLPQYHKFPHKLYLNKSTEYAVKNATHLIAISETTKLDLIKKLNCPEEKITVIYEGFDNKKFFPKPPKSPKAPYLLFVGTLQPRKNIERLIEAFAKVVSSSNRPNNPNIPNLVLVGNRGWLYDDILTAPKRFGVEGRVKFLGYTKEDDLPNLYRNALCFCLPSLFEGFGLPVLEAMACGCPVVVSNTSSLPEVAGDAGLYVDPLNVNDIAKKLELIIKNVKLRNDLKKKGLKQAQKFSWKKAARETINILETLQTL